MTEQEPNSELFIGEVLKNFFVVMESCSVKDDPDVGVPINSDWFDLRYLLNRISKNSLIV